MKRNIDPSTVSRLMSLSRQVIEETGTKYQYPTLNLFCDWSLHPKLDRKSAQAILATIEDALRKEMEWAGHLTAGTLLATISPRRLQEEMIDLLARNRIDPNIAQNPQHFVPIAILLREEVIHKPLEIADKKLKEKLEMAASVGKRAQIVRSLTIEPDADPNLEVPFVIKVDVRLYRQPRRNFTFRPPLS
jgi:hypothetical protein